MNHKELVNHIANIEDVPKSGVDSILKTLSDIVAEQLSTHGQITLHGIGTLAVVDTAARKGRNPQTGEEIEIPAGKRIKLKAAKVLKDAVA